jgi:plasmid maintenance system killer protein
VAMIEISTTATFDRLFRELPRQIQQKAARRTDLFKINPFHPSLRTEKLHPKHHEVWSFRIDQTYRIVFKFVGAGHAELRYVGHHHFIYNFDLFR